MSDTIDLSALGGQIPPHRVFRVVTKRPELVLSSDGSHYHSAGEEQTIMAHMMSPAEGGILIFYTWRVETVGERPVVVQYCTDVFAKYDEAHEVQMPAVKTGKAH